MNKVLLVGRLTRDPELRTTPTGQNVTRFSLAVSQNFVGRNGERGVDFINCTVWGRNADNVAKYCRKGTMVSVEGRISTGSYTHQDGTKRYTTEVVCENVNFLSTKSDTSNVGNSVPQNNDFMAGNDFNSMTSAPLETADLSEDPFKSFSEEIALSSDDLPF